MEFPEKTKIQSHTITIVPRYCETDKAGVVHHSVYPVWFEMGRTELLRANGLAYRKLEEAGTNFVVAELNIKYRRPTRYDEKLLLTTTCTNITTARVEHTYQLKHAKTHLLLTEATSTLACVNNEGKPLRIPDFMYPETKIEPTKTQPIETIT